MTKYQFQVELEKASKNLEYALNLFNGPDVPNFEAGSRMNRMFNLCKLINEDSFISVERSFDE
jgi:hypothetical protein